MPYPIEPTDRERLIASLTSLSGFLEGIPQARGYRQNLNGSIAYLGSLPLVRSLREPEERRALLPREEQTIGVSPSLASTLSLERARHCAHEVGEYLNDLAPYFTEEQKEGMEKASVVLSGIAGSIIVPEDFQKLGELATRGLRLAQRQMLLLSPNWEELGFETTEAQLLWELRNAQLELALQELTPNQSPPPLQRQTLTVATSRQLVQPVEALIREKITTMQGIGAPQDADVFFNVIRNLSNLPAFYIRTLIRIAEAIRGSEGLSKAELVADRLDKMKALLDKLPPCEEGGQKVGDEAYNEFDLLSVQIASLPSSELNYAWLLIRAITNFPAFVITELTRVFLEVSTGENGKTYDEIIAEEIADIRAEWRDLPSCDEEEEQPPPGEPEPEPEPEPPPGEPSPAPEPETDCDRLIDALNNLQRCEEGERSEIDLTEVLKRLDAIQQDVLAGRTEAQQNARRNDNLLREALKAIYEARTEQKQNARRSDTLVRLTQDKIDDVTELMTVLFQGIIDTVTSLNATILAIRESLDQAIKDVGRGVDEANTQLKAVLSRLKALLTTATGIDEKATGIKTSTDLIAEEFLTPFRGQIVSDRVVAYDEEGFRIDEEDLIFTIGGNPPTGGGEVNPDEPQFREDESQRQEFIPSPRYIPPTQLPGVGTETGVGGSRGGALAGVATSFLVRAIPNPVVGTGIGLMLQVLFAIATQIRGLQRDNVKLRRRGGEEDCVLVVPDEMNLKASWLRPQLVFTYVVAETVGGDLEGEVIGYRRQKVYHFASIPHPIFSESGQSPLPISAPPLERWIRGNWEAVCKVENLELGTESRISTRGHTEEEALRALNAVLPLVKENFRQRLDIKTGRRILGGTQPLSDTEEEFMKPTVCVPYYVEWFPRGLPGGAGKAKLHNRLGRQYFMNPKNVPKRADWEAPKDIIFADGQTLAEILEPGYPRELQG